MYEILMSCYGESKATKNDYHCNVGHRLNPMSASMTVLTSELKMCQELLEIEPDNKCMENDTNVLSVVLL